MEHINAKVVLSVDVCSIRDKKLTSIRISFERSKMKGCKAVTMVFLIDPSCDVIFNHPRRY